PAPATPDSHTLSLHDALPIWPRKPATLVGAPSWSGTLSASGAVGMPTLPTARAVGISTAGVSGPEPDRTSSASKPSASAGDTLGKIVMSVVTSMMQVAVDLFGG